jgi:hypothetical protein
MTWDTDQPPIKYLERRVQYYKKKLGTVHGLLNVNKHEFMWRKYGNRLPEIIERRCIQIEKRIKEFNKAIKILSANDTRKGKIQKR